MNETEINIPKILNALAYFELYSNQESYQEVDKKQWYKFAADFITSSKSFEGTKTEDVLKWDLSQIRTALSKVNLEIQSATTPEKEMLEEQQLSAEKKERIEKEARERARKTTSEQIRTFQKKAPRETPAPVPPTKPTVLTEERSPEEQERYEKAREIINEPEKFVAPSVVYVKPIQKRTIITLNPQEAQEFLVLAEAAATHPQETVQALITHAPKISDLPPKLANVISPETYQAVLPLAAQASVKKLQETAQVLKDQPPQERLNSLSQVIPSPDQAKVLNWVSQAYKIDGTEILTSQQAAIELVSQAILPPKVANSLYGIPQEEYQETQKDDPEAIQVDLNKVSNLAKNYKDEVWQQLTGLARNPEVQSTIEINTAKIINGFKLEPLLNFVSSTISLFEIGPGEIVFTGGGVGAMASYHLVNPTLFTAWEAYAQLPAVAASIPAPQVGAALVATPVEYAPGAYLIMPSEVPFFGAEVAGAKLVGGAAGAAAEAGSTAAGAAAGEVAAGAAGAAATETALATTGAAAGAATGAEVGTAVAPIIGTIIGALVGFVASFIPKIYKWVKKHTEDLAIGAATILLSGVFIGSIPLIVGGGVALGGLAFTGAGVNTLKAAGSGLAKLLATGLGAAFADIAKPIIITLLSIPIAVGLIMFIINSGAYLVPGYSIGAGKTAADRITPSACPLDGGVMGDGSYTPGIETTGHGSNNYWKKMGGHCLWALPQKSGCMGPTNSGNVCSSQSTTCPFYGYAMDAFPRYNWAVYAPEINDEETDWKYNGIQFLNGSGGSAGSSIGLTDASGRYSIILTHIDTESTDLSKTFHSGDRIVDLHNQGSNTHLHIELQEDGIYQRPEDFFICDGSRASSPSASPQTTSQPKPTASSQ